MSSKLDAIKLSAHIKARFFDVLQYLESRLDEADPGGNEALAQVLAVGCIYESLLDVAPQDLQDEVREILPKIKELLVGKALQDARISTRPGVAKG